MATVLVTEVDAGIGADLAIGLAAAGNQVIAASRSGTFQHPGGAGLGIVPLEMDLSSPVSVQTAVAEAADSFPSLDVLVANGDVGTFAPLELLAPAALGQLLTTNLVGQLLTMQAVIPHLRRSPRPRIIGISSAVGLIGLPGGAVPCAARAGFEVALDALRHELRPFGVKVSIVQAAPPSEAAYGLPSALGPAADGAYRPLVDSVNEFGCETLPTEFVVRAVLRALTEEDPKFRYSLGAYAGLASQLRRADDEESAEVIRDLFEIA